MTVTPPLGAGDPGPWDFEAAEQLRRNEAGRLDLVRARAEKWIGGISALGGLLSVVLVVKGRETATAITRPWQVAVASSLGMALCLFAFGTYRAYQAAFGDPDALAEIDPNAVTGLHGRLLHARREAADSALSHLATALKAIFAALALVAAGVAITWFAPAKASTSATLCVYSRGRLVIELGSPPGDVRQTAPDGPVAPCGKGQHWQQSR